MNDDKITKALTLMISLIGLANNVYAAIRKAAEVLKAAHEANAEIPEKEIEAARLASKSALKALDEAIERLKAKEVGSE